MQAQDQQQQQTALLKEPTTDAAVQDSSDTAAPVEENALAVEASSSQSVNGDTDTATTDEQTAAETAIDNDELAAEAAAATVDDDSAVDSSAMLAATDDTDEKQAAAAPVPVERKVRRVKKFYARDFANSSWAVGIVWGTKRKVQSTQLFMRDDGTLVWLDGGKGSWRLNTQSRSLGFYRDFFLGWKGKRVFSTRLLDNCNEHYLEGDIKGWGPWFPLQWMGQFQAIRMGVDLSKHGPAPWENRPPPTDFPDNSETIVVEGSFVQK
jgi:hypothetical protein